VPVLRNRTVFEAWWGLKAFLNLDVGITRGAVPGIGQARSQLAQARSHIERLRKQLSNKDRQLERLRKQLSEKIREVRAAQTEHFSWLAEKNAKAQSEHVRLAADNLRNEIRIAKMIEDSTEDLHSLKGKKGLKVHLGCGSDIRPGWVNIDLALTPKVTSAASAAPPGATYINYDLRRGLPLENDSCDYIYSSHFFEHLQYKDGLRLMRECYRMLRPGGVFRVSLPNFKGMFAAYLRGDESYLDLIDILSVLPEVEPGTETLVDHINYGVYQHGEHKYIYDEDKVILILQKIGYPSVVLSSYQEGTDPGEEVRRRYSFYVEATK